MVNLKDTTAEGIARFEKQAETILGVKVTIGSTELPVGNSYYILGNLTAAQKTLLHTSHPVWEGRPVLYSV